MKDRFNMTLKSSRNTRILYFNFQIVFCIILFFFACTGPKDKKTVIVGMDEGKDSTISDLPPMIKLDSAIIDNPAHSINALANDSVFTDSSRPISRQVAGIKDDIALRLFVKNLQDLVAANRKMEIANHIRYPLNKTIKTKRDFFRNYNLLFTPAVKESLAKNSSTQLPRNGNRVLIAGGKLWIVQQGKDFKIIAINN